MSRASASASRDREPAADSRSATAAASGSGAAAPSFGSSSYRGGGFSGSGVFSGGSSSSSSGGISSWSQSLRPAVPAAASPTRVALRPPPGAAYSAGSGLRPPPWSGAAPAASRGSLGAAATPTAASEALLAEVAALQQAWTRTRGVPPQRSGGFDFPDPANAFL